MAVTKTHPIKLTLKAAIDYICNPEKTDGKLLVSAYGCAAETADIEFSWTRRHAIDKGTNLGRHLIQAFQPGEVTPEQAHEIGMELAKEILGGKYISAKAPDQERFTRLKTLGVDYTEEALAARIAGCSRPSHQPKPQNGKISLLIDIQNNIKAQQSAGFTHWAKLNNLKQAARELKRLGAVPLPITESMKTELAKLNAEKERLLAEYKTARTEAQEYDTVKQNVDALLAVPKEQEQQRRHELE